LKRAAATIAAAALGIVPSVAMASPSSGGHFTTLTLQNFAHPDERHHHNSENIKFQTKEQTIVRIQSATWNVGATSGWHHHPGVIMGVVTSGSVTVWDGSCNQKTYGPGLPLGAVFLEGDNMLMQATSGGGATEYVVHTIPVASPPVFRV